MTKALNTLIKFNKYKLDKIIKEVKYNKIEKIRLEHKKTQLEQNLNKEIKKYFGTEYSFILTKYIEHSNNLIKKINAQIDQHQNMLHNLLNDLKKQYSELKKFEIIAKNRKIIEKEKIQKQEQKELDEINILKF